MGNCHKSNKFCIYALDCEKGLVECYKSLIVKRNAFLGLAPNGETINNQIIGSEIL